MDIYLIISAVCTTIAVLIMFHKDWLPNFRPDLYFIFAIFQDDLVNYKEHYIFLPISGVRDKYSINKHEYSRAGFKSYRKHNVEEWFFTQGNSLPIAFTPNKDTVDSKLAQKLSDSNLDDFWITDEDMKDWLKKNIVWIGIGLVAVGALIYLATKQAESTQLIAYLINKTG